MAKRCNLPKDVSGSQFGHKETVDLNHRGALFHASLFFVFLVVFPFSRLVHIITFPLRYLTRPFQLVKWLRRDPPVSSAREPVGAGRT